MMYISDYNLNTYDKISVCIYAPYIYFLLTNMLFTLMHGNSNICTCTHFCLVF